MADAMEQMKQPSFDELLRFEQLATACEMFKDKFWVAGALESLKEMKSMAYAFGAHYFKSRCKEIERTLVIPSIERCKHDQEFFKQAIPVLKFGASMGNSDACRLLVAAAQSRSHPNEIRESDQLDLLWTLVLSGDIDACISLAEIYDEGRQFQQRDKRQADRLYSQGYRLHLVGATKGSRYSMIRLGDLARIGVDGTPSGESGASVNEDHHRAVQWYRRVIEGESAPAGTADMKLDGRPKDELSAHAAIQIAEILTLSEPDSSGSRTFALLQWASRSGSGFAHRKLAEHLLQKDQSRSSTRKALWLLRRAVKLGDATSTLKYEILKREIRWKSKAIDSLFLKFDSNFSNSLESATKSPDVLFYSALYRLLIHPEPDLNESLETLRRAFSTGFKTSKYFHDNLTNNSHLESVVEGGRIFRKLISGTLFIDKLIRLYADLISYLPSNSHYNRQFIRFRELLSFVHSESRSRTLTHWLELVSFLADCFDVSEKAFWNQLLIDSQISTKSFENFFFGAGRRSKKYSPRSVESTVRSSTQEIGICYNVRRRDGLPVVGRWRNSTPDDLKGWQRPPRIRITQSGFECFPPAKRFGSPPMIAEQDVVVILALALLEGGTKGSAFHLSLEPLQEAEKTDFAWKFVRKDFKPPWLAATEFGKTMYYCDVLHLPDTQGRSIYSSRNCRRSAEYDPKWHLEWPWNTTAILGASAYGKSGGRSGIHLAKVVVRNKLSSEQTDQIIIEEDFVPLIGFDASETIWRSGVEDRSIGKYERRFRCGREAEFKVQHYLRLAKDYPVFERIAYLHGLYGIVCKRLQTFKASESSPLIAMLKAKRKNFQSMTDVESAQNPRLVVFDLR